MSFNRAVMVERLSVLEEERKSIPSAAAMARSSGVVMKPRTRSALAPTYTVVTVIVAFSLRGYWRTVRFRMAWTPAMTITRFTTSARMGRRMKRSVNDFMTIPGP